jgi:hypothetical protein
MQRIIGIGLGALTTFVLLFLMKPGIDGSDPNQGYLIATIAGAIVSLAWPWVIGFFLVRRAKDRREEEIEKEVQRQLAEERKQGQ